MNVILLMFDSASSTICYSSSDDRITCEQLLSFMWNLCSNPDCHYKYFVMSCTGILKTKMMLDFLFYFGLALLIFILILVTGTTAVDRLLLVLANAPGGNQPKGHRWGKVKRT